MINDLQTVIWLLRFYGDHYSLQERFFFLFFSGARFLIAKFLFARINVSNPSILNIDYNYSLCCLFIYILKMKREMWHISLGLMRFRKLLLYEFQFSINCWKSNYSYYEPPYHVYFAKYTIEWLFYFYKVK